MGVPEEDIANTLDIVTKGSPTTSAQTTAAQTTAAQTIFSSLLEMPRILQSVVPEKFTNPPPFVPQGLPTFLSTKYSKLL